MSTMNRNSTSECDQPVKFRYPCSGLAPVPVFHLVRGSGGVDPAGFASGVGERSVFTRPVVTDGMDFDDLTTR